MRSIILTCALPLVLAPAGARADNHSNTGGLGALAERVAALEAAAIPAPTFLEVACPADSLASAVERAVPGIPLTIVVSGRCAENVDLRHDDVTIEGATRADGIDGRVRIVGSRRVTLRNLTVENLDGTAINVREGASATLADVTAIGDLQSAPNSGGDGYGIFVTRGAYAQLDRVDARVLSGGNNALLLNDGASARSVDGSFVSESDTAFDNAAIGLWRGATLRMDGQPLIENRNSLGGGIPLQQLAVWVATGSVFRISDEIAQIRGSVRIANNSTARIRRVGGGSVGPGTLDGSVEVIQDSNLELGTRSTLELTGFAFVGDQSLLVVNGRSGSITTTNGLDCSGPSAGILNPGVFSPFPSGAGCSLF